ncbi:MAG TPA: pitrilysin family protein, partial [Clostridia bacterium]|nr:pitrilysin family protein [Clostridia bacterium]
AIFAVRFGSVDLEFVAPMDNHVTKVPDGVAHFLEHKLFEQEDGNMLDKFVSLGASPNAATSFNWTYYYFTCTDRFEECFGNLLYFVLNPYITEESVEKEKGIISQEINMYLDAPDFIVSMELLRLMYHNNPIRNDIAGSVESISKITADILLKCHETFYHPSNMVVTVVGDVDPKEIQDVVDRHIPKTGREGDIKRIEKEEPLALKGTESILTMDVSLPLFNIGFKDDPVKLFGSERVRREIAGSILKEMMFGKVSTFYETLYNEGVISNDFYADYETGANYALFSLGGESQKPQRVREYLEQYIEEIRKNGFDKKYFEMVKNALSGRVLRRFNSPESMGRMFASSYLIGVDAFDYFTAYGTINLDESYHIFEEVFLKPMAVSIVNPK